MKALALNLKNKLTIKKNTHKNHYLKIKEIKENIDHINNIKVLILLIALLLLIISIAFNLYYFAIIFGGMVIITYFGLNVFQKIMNYKIINQ